MLVSKDNAKWLVIDTRTTQHGINSGISRFVVSLSRALAEVLAQSTTGAVMPFVSTEPESQLQTASGLAGEVSVQNVRLLLVGKNEPPPWAVDLVRQYPRVVSFWSGGPGALSRRWDKPVYFWPTRVLTRIAAYTNDNFLWLAPANFDRPLLVSSLKRKKHRARIIQFIHDTIPLTQGKSMGFLFRTQFRFFVNRTLLRFPNVFTSSQHTADLLRQTCQKRSKPVFVLELGIEPKFGAQPLMPLGNTRDEARRRFLCALNPALAQPDNTLRLNELVAKKWVVGVGRYQKYKGWELAEEAVTAVDKSLSGGALFIRVGLDPKESARFQKQELRSFGFGAWIEQIPCLGILNLGDEALVQLYRMADCLVHPSRAEGFGFPPVEAALCGLPVVYRAGTAVDEHFKPGELPESYWNRVPSDAVADWTAALLKTLGRPNEMSSFLASMAEYPSVRAFFEHVSRGTRFSWQLSATRFLQHLELGLLPPGVSPVAQTEASQ